MPKTKFLQVTCPECGNNQTIFSNASTEVHCAKCSALLAKPTGGKAVITGKLVKVHE
jgi:small subunit ribosomal protein S27e